MQTATLIIINKVGLHARPAALFVKSAMAYQAAITVAKGEKTANAKSLLSVLGLGVCQNDEITITADGPDEADALRELVELVQSNFGEPNGH
jgi:phosphocarrier protein HPr